MNHKKRNYILLIMALTLVGVCGGVSLYQVTKVQASEVEKSAGPQVMQVEVDTIEPKIVDIWKNFSGHVVAVDHADIRPQVSGRITEVRFEGGQRVEKGDILIIIDPRPYEANLNQAKAALEVAEIKATHTEKEYQRATRLIDADAISQSLLEERTNNRESARAAVQGAQALLEAAQINLDYAYVRAPISGKVSRVEITQGNLVQAGSNAPLLTSIVADEKVYVDFEVDERTYLISVQSAANTDVSKIPVRLALLSADKEYNGFVYNFDNQIDPASGTIRARAIFENKDGTLLPGMSVSILMGSAGKDEKILVSERAIGTDQDRKFVYVIGGDKAATYREVKLGESMNGMRVILSGLEPGETVITEGLVRIRPGMKVTPKLKTVELLQPDQDKKVSEKE